MRRAGPTDLRRPAPPVTVAGTVAGLEAVALVALAAAEVSVPAAGRVGLAVTTAGFFAACGVGIGWCARGLVRHRSWARGPLVMTQLLVLTVAWTYRGPYPAAAAGLGAVALLGLGALLHPGTTRSVTAATTDESAS